VESVREDIPLFEKAVTIGCLKARLLWNARQEAMARWCDDGWENEDEIRANEDRDGNADNDRDDAALRHRRVDMAVAIIV